MSGKCHRFDSLQGDVSLDSEIERGDKEDSDGGVLKYGSTVCIHVETEAAARSLPEAYLKYVEEKRRSDNEGIRVNANGASLRSRRTLP